jgi:hypothetical protein
LREIQGIAGERPRPERVRHAPSARRSLAWAALAAGALGCTGGSGEPRSAGRPADGWIGEGLPAPTASTRSTAPTERWNLTAELARLRPATRRAPSEHLGGDLEGEVLASPEAHPYPSLGPRHAVRVGATLVERHSPPGQPDVAAYFAMIKRPPGFDPDGGDWEYAVIAPDGRVEQRGVLPLCARCHADAPHDHLFGGSR